MTFWWYALPLYLCSVDPAWLIAESKTPTHPTGHSQFRWINHIYRGLFESSYTFDCYGCTFATFSFQVFVVNFVCYSVAIKMTFVGLFLILTAFSHVLPNVCLKTGGKSVFYRRKCFSRANELFSSEMHHIYAQSLWYFCLLCTLFLHPLHWLSYVVRVRPANSQDQEFCRAFPKRVPSLK